MRPLFALALLLAAPAAAQRAPEWRTAPEEDVLLRPFAYEPSIIRLRAGQSIASAGQVHLRQESGRCCAG